MDHLAEDELYTMVFDGVALSINAAQHLAGCPVCQQSLAALEVLAGELVIAQRSAPSAAALQRYASLFDAVQREPSLLQQVWQTVRAALAWDSRQPPARQGVRSSATASYRLLYTAAETDIELLVEPGQRGHRIEGDVVLGDGATVPALVQLVAADGGAQHETETDAYGRFQLGDVAPGAYNLLLTLTTGQSLEVTELEIT